MLLAGLRRQMDEMHARFKGAHHLCRRLVEHVLSGHMIEEAA